LDWCKDDGKRREKTTNGEDKIILRLERTISTKSIIQINLSNVVQNTMVRISKRTKGGRERQDNKHKKEIERIK